MKTFMLLFFSFVLVSTANAQNTDTLALDPAQFVNVQILADKMSDNPHTVYSVEPGTFYAFDGQLSVTSRVEIVGPDNGWIKDDATPPVLLNTADLNGGVGDRRFFELEQDGELVLKNLMVSGLVVGGADGAETIETLDDFTLDTAGSLYMAYNVAFANWTNRVLRTRSNTISISVNDCVFINGVRTSNSPWGGFPLRVEGDPVSVTVENNTVVNSGRLIANSGPFEPTIFHELHNTYMNSTKAGHEMRAFEMIQANNIFYNFDFLGRRLGNNTYDSYFTTWNYFADVAQKLDSTSLYFGQNLMYREPEVVDWFETASGEGFSSDTLFTGLLWEHADVDSLVTMDDDYTIGTNYAEFDPGFAAGPGNTDQILGYMSAFWGSTDWVDWRIDSPISYDGSQPMMNAWPPSFDLSYSNEFLQTAGTDGLPLGDLNWFPDAKASYMENRDQHIAALRDSIDNAVAVYVPGSPTPLITPSSGVSVEDGRETPDGYRLDQNYPNPFNPTTNITFNLPEAVHVKLSVYNMLGQRVAILINDELRTPGHHNVQWDGRDGAGKLAASGMYVYRLEADDFMKARTMLLVK